MKYAIRQSIFSHWSVVLTIALVCTFHSCNLINGSNGTGNNSSLYKDHNSGRDTWQKPQLVVDNLGDISDKTIADIGAGTGYFTFRLAFEAKKVIAVEIDPEMIKIIEAFKNNLPVKLKDKVITKLVESDDPGLTQDSVDIAVIINTIAYIENPQPYITKLKDQLNAGGYIMIVDFKKKFLPIDAPVIEERLGVDEVEALLRSSGIDKIEINSTSLDYQYIIKAYK